VALAHVGRIVCLDSGASVAKLGKLLVGELEQGTQAKEAPPELQRRLNR
jgi:hypothetical protein